MAELDILITIVGFIAILAVLIGLFTAHERRHTRAEKDLEELDRRVKKTEIFMENLSFFTSPEMRQAFVDLLLHSKVAGAPGNPYTVEEKERLLRLYRSGDLDLTQARRLQQIMNEEATEATNLGDVVAIIAIIAILIGLGALIAAMITASSNR